jgi:adenylosuccinate lyase
VVRANALAAMENMALWHERDISHSSVERVIAPDSTILIDYMMNRLKGIINGLVVHPENMARNMQITKGLVFSQQVLMRLAEKGIERQKAYVMVQRNALKVWEGEGAFKELILNDKEIMQYLDTKEVEEIFDVKYHLKHVDEIFERVFG